MGDVQQRKDDDDQQDNKQTALTCAGFDLAF